jgi:hypothetical protein
LAGAPAEDPLLVGLAELALVEAEVAEAALPEVGFFAEPAACRERAAGQLRSTKVAATSSPLLTREAIPCAFLVLSGARKIQYLKRVNYQDARSRRT